MNKFVTFIKTTLTSQRRNWRKCDVQCKQNYKHQNKNVIVKVGRKIKIEYYLGRIVA